MKQSNIQVQDASRVSEEDEESTQCPPLVVSPKLASQLLDDAALERSFPRRMSERMSGSAGSVLRSPQVKVEASSLPLSRCDPLCVCQCHQFTKMASPIALSQIIGRLFVGYVGLPLLEAKKCNRIPCNRRRNQVEIRVSYLFPLWFILRFIALTITKTSTAFMWKLSVPVVTQTTAPLLVFTSLGDIKKIQTLLGTNEGFLNGVDAVANKSPLHVSNRKNLI